MVLSGIALEQEVQERVRDINFGGRKGKVRALVLKVSDDKRLVEIEREVNA